MTKLGAKILIPVFGIALISSGCVTYQLTPHVAGRVIDLSTKEPIANATLYFDAFPSDVILSEDAGYFDLPAIERTKLMSGGPPKDMAMSRSLVVKADGYQTDEINFAWRGGTAPAETNETIYLQPK